MTTRSRRWLFGAGAALVVWAPSAASVGWAQTSCDPASAYCLPAPSYDVPTAKLAPKLTIAVRPGRDRKAPFAYRVSGRLRRPSGVGHTAGCTGTVTIALRRGERVVGRAVVPLRKRCRYVKRVVATGSLRGRRGTLTLRASFNGNAALSRASSPRRTVGFGRRGG